MSPDPLERALEVADRIRALLATKGVKSAVIGAAALAAHGYARGTADLDLGVATDLATLAWLEGELERQKLGAELVSPDAQDPLGGVVNVRASGPELVDVQVVNFVNPFKPTRNPGPEAIHAATLVVEGTQLPVVDLPHLVALKLYAGGLKSRVDVVELLRRNPGVDLRPVREVSERFGFTKELEEALRELGSA